MGFVPALLSVKVYLAARTGLVPRVVLPPKTLLARPRFDPRPVHREMLVRQIRLGQDEYPLEKRLGDLLVQRSEEHTSELQSRLHLVCRLLLEKKKPRSRTSIYQPQIR